MPKIANLLFDFGNVILDIDIPYGRQQLYSLIEGGIPAPEIVEEVEQLINTYDKGEITSAEFVGVILKYCREGVTEGDVVAAWNSLLQGIPNYRLGMLQALKENFTLILHSNTNEIHIDWVSEYILKNHDIRQFEKYYFDETYLSFKIGKRKPEEDFYQHLIDDAMITPEQSIFIDDLKINIDTAKEFGFQTLHLKPGMEIAEVLKLRGYY